MDTRELIMVAPLPYAHNALEPIISTETISYHYGKHYQAYVDNLNAKIAGTEWEDMSLAEMIKVVPDGPVFNNAGQAFNHMMYFLQFQPSDAPETAPSKELKAMIERDFGTLEILKQKMTQVAISLFGSGWAWLEVDSEGKLCVSQYLNADTPLRHGKKPLLCIDVWEHAYYLDWQNRRADYVGAIWSIIDWNVVAQRLKQFA